MDNNRDWKPIIALALAGLALFIALGGPRGGNGYPAAAPQQIIVQPAAPSGGATAPVVAVPGAYTGVAQPWGGPGWGGGHHHFNPFFPILFFGGLIFLAFWLFGRNRRRWAGGYGGNGGPCGGPGPGPGPQGPPHGQAYGQYPPQNPQPQQPQQPQQGQPTQSIDAHGDITRPEGSGDN
jgi:hypothetical protein